MAFLEKFTAKTKALANRMSDKNKDNSEVKRLEKEKKQIQKELEVTFNNLGKYFYEHKEDLFPEDYEGIVDHIDQLKSLISDKDAKISAVKDRISCPHCGRMMPKDSLICPSCGKSVILKPQAPAIEMDPEKVYCPVCGAENEAEAAVCKECGTPLQMHQELENELFNEPASEEKAAEVEEALPEEAVEDEIAAEINGTFQTVRDVIEEETKEADITAE